jgi:PTS system nitrogen regulatory IIA component
MPTDDFDVDSLAAYLHVTPAQIRRMVDRGRLPARKIGGEWRFSRAEMHHWLEERIGAAEDDDVLAKVEDVLQRDDTAKQEVSISDMLPIEAMSVPLNARTQARVIERMVETAAQTGWLWDPVKMIEAVNARETLHSTALDIGVALLHPRRPQNSILAQPFLAFGRTFSGIPFSDSQGKLTDVFFLILSTEDRGHLRTLARLSRFLGDPQFLASIREAEDAVETHRVIEQFEQSQFG